MNLVVADETSNIKVVLWDTHHIGFIERGEIEKDHIVEISNASMRDNEIHLGSFSEFKKSNEDIKEGAGDSSFSSAILGLLLILDD